MAIEGIRCPECKSTEVWLKGSVPTRQGPKRRYLCTKCGRSFYEEQGRPKSKRKSKGKSG